MQDNIRDLVLSLKDFHQVHELSVSFKIHCLAMQGMEGEQCNDDHARDDTQNPSVSRLVASDNNTPVISFSISRRQLSMISRLSNR